ncbi:CHAT domain-containing protein [Desulfovibrio sp.]|uniref:CHAT domain-containing protein n=1 Tax=Desulfovibrio sp. TaxID=885 RepID=UPI003D14B94E
MKLHKICTIIVVGIALFFSFGNTSHASSLFVPFEDWQIMQRKNSQTGKTFCVAHTKTGNYYPLIFDFNIVLSPTGGISFEIIAPKTLPWREYGPEQTSDEGASPLRSAPGLFGFDSGSNMPSTEYFESSTRRSILVPQNSRGLGEKLRVASHLRIKGKICGDNDVHYLPNIKDIMKELEICSLKMKNGDAYTPTSIPVLEQTSGALFEPIKVRLEKSEPVIARQRKIGGGWRSEFLPAGEAAADALRLQDAYVVLSPAIAAASKKSANSAEVHRAIARLIEVLMLLERFDEAKAVAPLHPQKIRFLGAIAKAEGYWEESRELFSKVVQKVSAKKEVIRKRDAILDKMIKDFEAQGGRRSTNYMDIMSDRPRQMRQAEADRQAAEMSELLLLWGLGSLGQEAFERGRRCFDRDITLTESGPAFFGSQALAWRESSMLNHRDGSNADHRRTLGMAAYMRGVDLQSGGCLQMSKVDLSYALHELKDGSGADGWAMLTELALLRQMDAVGQTAAAKNGAAALLRRIENHVGKPSLPWLETSAFIFELASRADEPKPSLSQMEEMLSVAADCLPANHSLRIRLTRTVAAMLAKEGDIAQALQVTVKGLGITVAPRLTEEQFKEAKKIVDAAMATRVRPKKLDFQTTSKELALFRDSWIKAEGQIANSTTLNSMSGLSHFPPISSQVAASECGYLASFLDKVASLMPDSDERRYCSVLATIFTAWNTATYRRVQGFDTFKDLLAKRGRFDRFDQEGSFEEFGEMGRWMMAVFNRVVLTSLFPSYNRDMLMPGPERVGMSRQLDWMLGLPIDVGNFNLFLGSIQAANKGHALGSLLARALLVEMSTNPQMQLDSRRSIEGDLYLRRQQGLLQVMLLQPERDTSASRIEIRKQYLLFQLNALLLRGKFDTSILTDERMKSFDFIHFTTSSGSTEYMFDTSEVQKRLTATQAMVVWYPLEEKTHVAVLRSDKMYWKVLPVGLSWLGRHVSAIRDNLKQVSNAAENGLTLSPFPVQDAAVLYQELVAPLEEELRGINHIFSVQLGVLGGIPLGLLVSKPVDAGAPVQWLINDLAITRMPALLNVELIERYRGKSGRSPALLFAAGAPVITETVDVAARNEAEDDTRRITLGPVLKEIKNAPQMMENVGRTLGADTKNMITGRKMSRTSVLKALQENTYKYMLFVTHGLVGGAAVGEPALYLSPPSGDNLDDDGLLRASEVAGLNFDTDLALLTACKTSVAGDDGSEPLSGLASAFLVAGARRVLASHWEVDASAAESITTGTISLIHKNKMDPAVALQQIMKKMGSNMQLDVLEGHPYYWAAFEVIGFPSSTSK